MSSSTMDYQSRYMHPPKTMSLKPMEKVVDYSYNICTTIVPMNYLAMGIIIIVRVVYSWVRLLLMTPLSQKTA